jgi:hypothetical protein
MKTRLPPLAGGTHNPWSNRATLLYRSPRPLRQLNIESQRGFWQRFPKQEKSAVSTGMGAHLPPRLEGALRVGYRLM